MADQDSSQNVIRVLIVDDDEPQCTLLNLFLSRFKDMHIVGTATDGVEAVESCGRLNPHVVVMDYMMPVMNGLVATTKIREQYPQIQVIILSAYHGDTLAHQAKEAGAFGCLGKEAMRTDLANSIRAASAVANSAARAS